MVLYTHLGLPSIYPHAMKLPSGHALNDHFLTQHTDLSMENDFLLLFCSCCMHDSREKRPIPPLLWSLLWSWYII